MRSPVASPTVRTSSPRLSGRALFETAPVRAAATINATTRSALLTALACLISLRASALGVRLESDSCVLDELDAIDRSNRIGTDHHRSISLLGDAAVLQQERAVGRAARVGEVVQHDDQCV